VRTVRSINRQIRIVEEHWPQPVHVGDLSDDALWKITGSIPLWMDVMDVLDDVRGSRTRYGPLRGDDLGAICRGSEWIATTPDVIELAIRNREDWEEFYKDRVSRGVVARHVSSSPVWPENMVEYLEIVEPMDEEERKTYIEQMPEGVFRQLQIWMAEIV